MVAIQIQITIHDSDIENIFKDKAPWYGKLFSAVGAVNKSEEVAKALSKEIEKKLLYNGIESTINYKIY